MWMVYHPFHLSLRCAVFISLSLSLYIYIYIYVERERDLISFFFTYWFYVGKNEIMLLAHITCSCYSIMLLVHVTWSYYLFMRQVRRRRAAVRVTAGSEGDGGCVCAYKIGTKCWPTSLHINTFNISISPGPLLQPRTPLTTIPNSMRRQIFVVLLQKPKGRRQRQQNPRNWNCWQPGGRRQAAIAAERAPVRG